MRLDVQLTVRAWNAALPKGASKIVLLAVCKHVNDNSGLAFPSVTTLALLCGMSPRTVQGHLRALQRLGILVPRVVRTGYSTYYSVNLDGLPCAFPAGAAENVPVDNSKNSAESVDNSALTPAAFAAPPAESGTTPPQLSTLPPAESAPITGINFKENIERTAAPALPASAMMIDSVNPQVLAGFAAIRKAKRKGPVTTEVIEEICQQAHLAGLTLEQALQHCCHPDRRWARFEASWLQAAPRGCASIATTAATPAMWKPPVSKPATPEIAAAGRQRLSLIRQTPPALPAPVAGIQIGTAGPGWAHAIVNKHRSGQPVSRAALREACTVLRLDPSNLSSTPAARMH